MGGVNDRCAVRISVGKKSAYTEGIFRFMYTIKGKVFKIHQDKILQKYSFIECARFVGDKVYCPLSVIDMFGSINSEIPKSTINIQVID